MLNDTTNKQKNNKLNVNHKGEIKMEYQKIDIFGSELPVEKEKGKYKYFNEVVGNGIYQQVAWEETKTDYIPLYSNDPKKLPFLNDLEIDFSEDKEF